MQFGGCPKVKLVAPFNAAGLQGKWYTTHIDWQFPMTIGAQCITQEYSKRSDGNVDLSFGATQLIVGPRAGAGTLYQCNEASDDWTC